MKNTAPRRDLVRALELYRRHGIRPWPSSYTEGWAEGPTTPKGLDGESEATDARAFQFYDHNDELRGTVTISTTGRLRLVEPGLRLSRKK